MFSQRLINLRKTKKLTQTELANKLGFTRGQISNYELGQREPDYETLNKLADFFDVSTDYLLGRTDDPSPQVRSKIVPEEILAELEEVIENQNIKFTVNGKVLDPEDDKMVRDMLRIAAERAKAKNKDLT